MMEIKLFLKKTLAEDYITVKFIRKYALVFFNKNDQMAMSMHIIGCGRLPLSKTIQV